MKETSNATRPDDQVLPRLRVELEASEHIYDGLPYWVVKDPLSLRYFRFSREEYFIIDQIGQGVTLGELKEAYRVEFSSDSLTSEEVGHFISGLMSKNLVNSDSPNRDEQLYQAGRRHWRLKIKKQATSFLFFRIPVYDPDELFNRMIPYLRFIWTRTFFGIYMLLLITATALVIHRWNDFSSMFGTHFFTLFNLPLLIGIVWLIKGLHEFGHGLTCKNYGGEVHELGWLFLIFAPFLYCNVTDSWTFPKKSHRFLVTAAGIMTELIFASIAAIIWYLTDQPRFIHTLCFNVVVACSISTILFNANPLLKYDGYYMLMDLIEVPNLRARATQHVRSLVIRFIFGGHTDEMPEEHRFRWIFPIYSVAAFIYRWIIVIGIMFLLYHMLDKIHLKYLGALLVAFSFLSLFLLPLVQLGKIVATKRQAYGISNMRLLFLLASLIAGAGMVFLWPKSHHVTLNFILEPQKITFLRSEESGGVIWGEGVRENAWVNADAEAKPLLARLDNPELAFEQIAKKGEIKQIGLDLDKNVQEGNQSGIQILRDRLETLEADSLRLQERSRRLSMTAPFSGRILSPDKTARELAGRFVETGEPLLVIADTRALVAKAWVLEKNLSRIFRTPGQFGQEAELMLYAFPRHRSAGKVTAISQFRQDNMGEFDEKFALSNKVGGEVLTELDPVTQREAPVESVYEITIVLEGTSLSPSARPYMSGRVRVDCGKSTLFQWGVESLMRFVSPEIWL